MKKPIALWTRLFAPPTLPRRRARRRLPESASASRRQTCGFDTLEPRVLLAWVGTQVDTTHYTITGYTGTATGALVVPADVSGVPVTTIAAGALQSKTAVTAVVIPTSVTTIGNDALKGCTSLTGVWFAGAAPTFGTGVFTGDTNVTCYYVSGQPGWPVQSLPVASQASRTIKLLGDYPLVYDIGDYSCGSNADGSVTIKKYNGSATSLVIPSTLGGRPVSVIAPAAFYLCGSLTSVEIPDGVTFIGDSAFGGCGSLASIGIPNSVTSLGESAFKGCTKLAGITIPSSVTSLGKNVFMGCTTLSSVEIPSSVTSLGVSAFEQCTSLASVKIPNSITAIAQSAFSGCTALTSIAIPNSVTRIDGSAFFMCTAITSVEIPSSVTTIGDLAFFGCTQLASVAIPDSVTAIGWTAFANCISLASIKIPDNVASIGHNAFTSCTSLTSVVIPSSVTRIESGVFKDCTSLDRVAIQGPATFIGRGAFSGCTQLTRIVIPGSVTTIEAEAFAYCPNLVAVYFNGDRPTTLGKNIFAKEIDLDTGFTISIPTGLKLYRLPESSGWDSTTFLPHLGDLQVVVETLPVGNYMTSTGAIHYQKINNGNEVMIDRPAFLSLVGQLTGDLVIPAQIDGKPVTQIGGVVGKDTYSPFASQPGLTSVSIPASVKYIEKESFSNCTGLRSVTFAPGSQLTEIQKSTFLGCRNLAEINLPAGLTKIGDNAFDGCGNYLRSIAIPATVTSIGNSAFFNCHALQSVYFLGPCPTFGDDFVFYGTLRQWNEIIGEYDLAVFYCLPQHLSSFASFPGGVTPASAPTDVSLVGGVIEIGNAIGDAVGVLSTADDILGNRFIYTLVSGTGSTDNGSFAISNGLLKANVVFTAAAIGSRSIRVRSTDLGGLSVDKTFTIRVTPVNHAATDIALSATAVAENAAAGVVGTLSTTDQDAGNTFTYTLADGIGSDNNDSFTIQGNQLQTTAAFDFESKTSYAIRVRTTDQGGLSYEKQFTISVTNVNEPPTVTSAAAGSVAENQTAVQTVTASDPDAATTLIYSISGGADKAKFAINASTGVLTFLTAPNFESPTDSNANNVYEVTVQVSDGTLTATKAVAVTVTDVNEAPTITIASNKTSLKAGETATITFTLSKSSTNFGLVDISATGGTVSNFVGTGTSYTATFTPTANSTAAGSISVVANAFTDADGNGNAAGSLSPTITIDTISPTVTIASSKSALKAGETATITFTLSEASTSFALVDVSATGGALSSFTGSGTSYTATFTPTVNSTTAGSISVAANTFTDAAGNGNTAGSLSPTITIDTVSPTITIASSKSALKAGETATITFTLSEASTNFALADVSATGGVLSNFVGLGTNYTATFTPTANSTTAGSISVAANTFTDTAGNGNTAGSLSPTITIDTVSPTITIASSKSALKAGETATITFTLSEASTNFAAVDVSATGGLLSSFAGSGTSYTATFTPTANSTTAGSISVAANTFTDAAGNGNTAGSLTPTITIDTVSPTVSIASSKAALKAGETATITFTLSEASTSFALGDVSATGGLLSNFVGSGTSYTATFTPTANSTAAGPISVAANTFTDTAGNGNTAGSLSPTITIDTISPTITIASNKTSLKAGETATITFTLSEASTNFTLVDVSATGGSLSNFGGLGTNYTATFTPTANSTTAGTISVAANTFTDTAGNGNTAGSVSPTITIDTVSPTNISLSATSVAENSIIGTVIGLLSTTDQNAGKTFTYSLVAGTGSTDNNSFTIQGNQLKTGAALDFESKTSYSICVRTTDTGGFWYEKQFAISVTNVNEAPSVTSAATASVAENQTAVQTVTGSDPDAATTLTYSISGGADAAKFVINSTTGALTFLSAPNFERPTDSGANNVYNVIVRVSGGGLTATKAVAVTVTNVNEAPRVAVPAAFTVVEDTRTGLAFTGTPFADVDSPSLTVTLVVADGTISAAGTTTVTVGGTATARTFTGTPAALNTYFKTLGTIGYKTAQDSTAPRTLTTTVSDGLLTATAFTGITITPVNDAPTTNPTATLGGGTVGTPYVMTYASLREALKVADVDNVSPSIVIQSINSGTLQKWSGTAWVTVSTAATATLAQRTLPVGGTLRWVPPAGVSGDRLAFKVRALDGTLYSTVTAQVSINLAAAV